MEMLYAALTGYFLGSLPFAYWFGLLQNKNMLEAGSGNIGAKNAWRVLGAVPGLMVLLLDIAKGIMAVALGEYLAHDLNGGLIAGALAVIGHCYSLLLFGNGGKGIATAAGVLFAVNPLILMGALVVFLGLYLLLRSMYRAVLFTALALPILSVAIGQGWGYLGFGLGVGLAVASRHLKDWNRA